MNAPHEGSWVLAVMGAGSMGAQIAQQAALHGVETRLHDIRPDQLERALASNRSHMRGRVERKRLEAAEMEAALSRVRPAPDLADAVDGSDIVIEAIVEQLEPKRRLFAELDKLSLIHI